MANWQTSTTSSEFNAQSYSENMKNERTGREGGDSSISGRNPGGLFGWGASGYDIVGMDSNQVEPMRNAIDAYVHNIETYLDNINLMATADTAFKGEEVQEAVKKYLDTCKKYCINLTSQLLAFSDQIQDASDQWKKSTQNIAQNINNGAAGFGTGSKYQSNYRL